MQEAGDVQLDTVISAVLKGISTSDPTCGRHMIPLAGPSRGYLENPPWNEGHVPLENTRRYNSEYRSTENPAAHDAEPRGYERLDSLTVSGGRGHGRSDGRFNGEGGGKLNGRAYDDGEDSQRTRKRARRREDEDIQEYIMIDD